MAKTIFGEKNYNLKIVIQFYLEIVTGDHLNYTMDHSKFTASIQKEEYNSLVHLCFYLLLFNSKVLNYMYEMMKHQIL